MAKILVAEPSQPISAALRKFLESVHHEVVVVHYLDEAAQMVREREPEVVLLSSTANFDGETLCAQLKATHPQCQMVLIYAPEEDQAFERAAQAQADAFLLGPLKKGNVVSTVQTMLRTRALKREIEELEAETAKLRNLAEVQAKAQAGFNTTDAQFFKKYLLMEVKRSKRYLYPLSLLLVTLDHLNDRLLHAFSPDVQRSAIRAETLVNLGQVIRDIDMAVPFNNDSYLIFLPHTTRDGALVVAGRLQARLARLPSFVDGTVSVGLSFYEPVRGQKNAVSFAALLREATAALKQAQSEGGGRVVAPPAPEKPKRDRISMG